MPTSKDEALLAKGRHGRFNQYPGTGERGPFFYGRVADVHSGGDYMLLETGQARRRTRWVHRRDVHLHPVADDGKSPSEDRSDADTIRAPSEKERGGA